MTISTKHLVDSVNTDILDPTGKNVADALPAAKIYDELKNNSVFSVATEAALPPAAFNTGRLIWVQSLNDYRYSNGAEWTRDFSSTTHVKSYVYTWGCATFGMLGNDNPAESRSSPSTIVGGFTDWCQISLGSDHTAAVRTNGTIWTWGLNLSGRLGDGTIISKNSPVSVVGGFTDWRQVSGGRDHTAAVRTNGTLWAWGCNGQGRLGDGTTTNRSSPVSVAGGFTDWCQVSAGGYHMTALRTNGTVWSWGSNTYGQLGDNSTVSRSSPVSIVGGFIDWCQVSAGACHSAAVRTNGTVWTWGANSVGQLGDCTSVSKSSPVSVVGGFTDWCQVSSGTAQTFGIRTNGTIWSWGFNSNGRLGDGTVTNKSSPVSVVGGFTDWCNVAAGQFHAFGIRTNGTIWGWGLGGNGRLGDNTNTAKSSPVSVVGGFTDWCQVSAGNVHSAAIRKITVGF